MVVRLKELLDVPGVRLVADDSSAASERAVSWVHSTELSDPSRYLSGGELILTTGVWRRAPSDSVLFVDALAQARVTAVGYGVTESEPNVPLDLVERCAKHRVPLLEISPTTPFIALSKRFVELRTSQQQASLHSALKRGEKMTLAIRQGRGITGILNSLGFDDSSIAVVISREGRLLGASSSPADSAEIEPLAAQLRAAPMFPTRCRLGERDAQAFEVHATGNADAYLIWQTPTSGLDDAARDSINRTLPYLGLEIARLGAIRATELRFASELIDLMEAHPPRLAELTRRLQTLGISTSRPLVVIACSIDVNGTRTTKERDLYDLARNLGVGAIVISRGDEDFLIVEVSPETTIQAIGEHLMTSLAHSSTVHRAALGLGNVAHEVDRLRPSLLQARQARAVAHSRPSNFELASFRDLGTSRLFVAIADQDVKDSLINVLLTPIRNHDRQRSTALEHTLQVYLDRAGNWKEAAEQLHIHVNTLRYRVERIEALTGRNLSTMADRVDFYLALQAAAAGTNSAGTSTP